jgi:hypothetical protein
VLKIEGIRQCDGTAFLIPKISFTGKIAVIWVFSNPYENLPLFINN